MKKFLAGLMAVSLMGSVNFAAMAEETNGQNDTAAVVETVANADENALEVKQETSEEKKDETAEEKAEGENAENSNDAAENAGTGVVNNAEEVKEEAVAATAEAATTALTPEVTAAAETAEYDIKPLTPEEITAIYLQMELSVAVNDAKIAFPDAKPFIDENSRTLIPLRAIGDALNLKVEWNEAARTASFTRGGKSVIFTIDNEEYEIIENGQSQKEKMDTKAIISEERTYAPVRYLAEAFGYSVGWNNDQKTVTITGEIPPMDVPEVTNEAAPEVKPEENAGVTENKASEEKPAEETQKETETPNTEEKPAENTEVKEEKPAENAEVKEQQPAEVKPNEDRPLTLEEIMRSW